MSYSRVTYEDRIKIMLLVQQGKSNTEIAKLIGKNKSTIGRELKRNTGRRGYRVKLAQAFADAREELKHQAYVLTDKLKKEIIKKLVKKWSPEQISNRLKLEKKPSASTETIYKFILHRQRERRRTVETSPSLKTLPQTSFSLSGTARKD